MGVGGQKCCPSSCYSHLGSPRALVPIHVASRCSRDMDGMQQPQGDCIGGCCAGTYDSNGVYLSL
jgi:hypothetical protein